MHGMEIMRILMCGIIAAILVGCATKGEKEFRIRETPVQYSQAGNRTGR